MRSLWAFTLILSVFGDDSGLITTDDVCETLTTPSDEYWDAVTSCSPCVRKGCGYCLSTLQCQGGDELGPRKGAMPCPSWVWADDSNCPVIPACGNLLSCSECAVHEMCAWCANDQKCMTIEETFYKDCRGAVFESPCPAYYTPGIHLCSCTGIIITNLISS